MPPRKTGQNHQTADHNQQPEYQTGPRAVRRFTASENGDARDIQSNTSGNKKVARAEPKPLRLVRNHSGIQAHSEQYVQCPATTHPDRTKVRLLRPAIIK